MSGDQLAAAIVDNHTELLRRECRVLELACAWADLHDQTGLGLEYAPLVERACMVGGPGTPMVSEFCVTELGALQGTGPMAARALVADALDLRYRLPMLWKQVQAGQVRAWQARKVAEQTRPLSWDACVELDAAISGFLGMLPWSRFQTILTAAILDADPELAAEREDRARKARDVWACDSDDGLKTLIAKATSGDVVWFLATVNRIADILKLEGDTDPVGVRRSKAIGILAQPAQALALLAAHRHDPAAAGDQEPAGDEDRDEDPEAGGEECGPHQPTPSDAENAAPSTAQGMWRILALRQAQGTPRWWWIRRRAALDLKRLRPKVVLRFHLSDTAIRTRSGLVRPEYGPAQTLGQFRDWLADTGCPVTVQPVLDPADVAPVDAYEIPQRTRDAVRLRNLADVFPYGSCTTATMDLDHTKPYLPMNRGGPPGQTSLANLGPMTRHHHRAVTHGRWGKRQPAPGQYLFRSPKGYLYLVTNQGTLPLGRTRFAQTIWHAATDLSADTA